MKNKDKNIHATSIGGQAVIEGVMMRGPKDIAIAVRIPEGTITVDKRPVSPVVRNNKFFKMPIIRGVVAFFESMVIGVSALMYSAEFFDIEVEGGEDYKPSKFEAFLEKVFGEKLKTALIYFSIFLSLIFGIGLFIVFPNLAVGFTKQIMPSGTIAKNIVEGIVRIAIFVIYILLVSKMKDIQRVFEYHGAEHKSIHCYEHEEELSVENVKKYSRLHPRCGTSFLLIVMVISIIVFSFLKWGSPLYRIGTRLLLLPLVAGLSYEIIKYAGRHDNTLTRIISWPGMMLQKLTTREPDDSQIEVAIAALNGVQTGDKEEDKW